VSVRPSERDRRLVSISNVALIEAGQLHRVALAVEDAGAVNDWFVGVLGAGPIGTDRRGEPGEIRPTPGEDDLEGTDTRLFRVGGFPFIILSKGAPGGPVANFLGRWGPGVHSLAWEVDDMWTVQNLLIRQGIRIGAVNIPGRHFFMHPRDTRGVLMEWTDDSFGESARRQDEGGGAIDVEGLAWVTAAVADATETAAFLADLCDATPVTGNAQGPNDQELTVDVRIGDITLRLVTPRSPESRYAAVLSDAPRLCSFALRVPDLDTALKALAEEGVPTVYRDDDLAATDPASTFGIPIEWTT
jgi:4-hydroxyphenylpyruvate dioxygenase-like putative hemolysin